MRLVVGIEIVLQFIYQPRQLFQAIVNFDARMLDCGTHYSVMDGVGALLDELDVELDPFVRLIRGGANLLLLVRCKGILGALRVRAVGEEETRCGEQEYGT
jgi:hypothetical protein